MKEDNNQIEQLEGMVQELNYLHQVSQRISEKKDIDVLLHEIMESCKEVTNAEASSLLIYDEEEDNLYFEVALGTGGEAVKKIICNMGEGIAGWVALNRQPLLVPDCYADERFNPDFDKQTGFVTRSMLCVPMLKDEKLVGVIQVINKKNGKPFTERDQNLFQILASQCGISIENARLTEVQIKQKAIEKELEMARMIQQNLLPDSLPEIENVDIAFRLKSAKEVGGDYFNVYRLDNDHTLFFISDVSGKSISAALIVSTICSCLMTYQKISTGDTDLKGIVTALNKVLIESTTDEKFATAWFGLLENSTGKLLSVNAGHNNTLIFREGNLFRELNAGGMFLGMLDIPYDTEEIQICRGDVIVCFTDGVSEAMNKDGQFYGEERLINRVVAVCSMSASDILNTVFNDVFKFTEDTEQSDDITCGVIKIN